MNHSIAVYLQGEKIDPESAIIMIPRAPQLMPTNGQQDTRTPSPPEDEVDGGPTSPASPSSPTSYSPVEQEEIPLNLDNMAAALPKKKGTRRAQVKSRDWKSSVQAYNAL